MFRLMKGRGAIVRVLRFADMVQSHADEEIQVRGDLPARLRKNAGEAAGVLEGGRAVRRLRTAQGDARAIQGERIRKRTARLPGTAKNLVDAVGKGDARRQRLRDDRVEVNVVDGAPLRKAFRV